TRRSSRMTQPRRGLGRGLDALIPGRTQPPPPGESTSTPPASQSPASPATSAPADPPAPPRRGLPETLDIDLIAPNPEQPRTHFEPEKLRELAESITAHGIIQPLIVSRETDGGYRLIAGERRLQA